MVSPQGRPWLGKEVFFTFSSQVLHNVYLFPKINTYIDSNLATQLVYYVVQFICKFDQRKLNTLFLKKVLYCLLGNFYGKDIDQSKIADHVWLYIIYS